ncbi:DNA gyrase/topoisomerase IV subunit B [Schlesneria paludicola]|uniref:DNA gyrase/topoisomerase IV subunit B n=1 Tax=Schlesneria paludicola TaxID=360056 RepID=UPI00029B5451|nr:DNA topoisomerase IV subunit B [Schlesneria paludicola]
MSNAEYTSKDIQVLEGLDHVRMRPSMYIGGTDTRGLHHLLWEIVDNSVDEHLAGHCNEIIVTLHKDASAVTVDDNGRGIPVDTHPKTKKSTLETVLTTLNAGGKFDSQAYARSGGLHGVGSSVTNALSIEMVATVRRDGYEWTQRYKRGRPTTPLKQVKPFRGHGTIIYFRPDDEIFSKTTFNHDTIRQHLEDIAYIHAGLKLTFIDEQKKEKLEFFHPDGIVSYLAKILSEGQKKAIHELPFSASRDDSQAKIEAVLQWTESTDEQLRSYVNGIRTHAGGTHESGFKSAIAKAVRNYMEVHDIKIKGVVIENSDIREGMLGILSVFLSNPMFQGQTKEKLNNPEMTAAVEGMVRPALETWLNNNPTIADAVIGRIVLAARARQASREAATDVRRKTSTTRRTNLPGKLMDCRATDPAEAELFIVEGLSAGGTAGMGRDSRTQAILPLRGKILNTETLATSKILESQEIKDLVETLGTGLGPNFDIRRLRYDRIILMMDADSDGYHISTLLLTFFFRHMRELIINKKLYLAQPPLYKIQVGTQIHYAKDDAHKEEILASLPANRKPEIGRFKGLGEMTAVQLKETTLDPKTRTLLAVDVDSLVEADQTFSQLLGKDASERYRIIMSEANLVDDLDV